MLESGAEIRSARRRAGLSQRRLAELAGTSQATIASYEAGRKHPSVETFRRLLAATGTRLLSTAPRTTPSPDDLRASGAILESVIALAETLPFERSGPLRYPPLPASGRA